jgi:fido (protein-threonine AMPylation protein)
MASVFDGAKGAGVLDYVTAWYMKAVQYVREKDFVGAGLVPAHIENRAPTRGAPTPREHIKIAFVSTNSITQGEQVGVLWSELLRLGVKLHFAHRTFSWSNEARGKAAVHCVIIGFALYDNEIKTIYDYPDIKGEPHALKASNINPYLVDAPDVFLVKRRMPICNDAPPIAFGSMPNDGGNLILTREQVDELLTKEPDAGPFIRQLMGSDEFINGTNRFCLWLVDASPRELKTFALVRARVERVKAVRIASSRETTRTLADSPTLFGEIRQPKKQFLAVPEVSSENRLFIPMGFLRPETIVTNKLYTINDASFYHFGILESSMHMAWVRSVCGRLKSDYQYSAGIVYNNFPWPDDLTDKQQEAIEKAAQGVLDARAAHPGSTLADLYDPIAMPPNLRQAHQALDRAVDAAYGKKGFISDAERVAFLFELYHKYTSLLPEPEKEKRTNKDGAPRSRKTTAKKPLPESGQVALSPDTCQNKDKEEINDKSPVKKSSAKSRKMAGSPQRHELFETGISEEDTGLGGEVHGVREGTGEYDPAEGAPRPGEGSTRPVDSTRYLETAQGIKSYAQVAEILAVAVARTIEALIEKDPADITISPEWICLLHGDIAGGLFPAWAGRFRDINVQVGPHHPPAYFEVPIQMRLFCDDLSARLSAVSDEKDIEKIAGTLAFADWRFQWIHPFKDFNGRVGRILLSAVLYKLRLPPAETASVDPEGKRRYLKALHDADSADLSTLTELWIERLAQV